ncbi:MAG: SEC-C domain-containing protein, partial [Actinomycetota bacterium]|nr:SEC-C domain-containing protein [Actinomycetota bacterium]
WLANLVLDLGRAGLGDEAAAVGEALAGVDTENEAAYHGDLAVALAEAGRADAAQARIAANLMRWPGDFWTQISAGDALVLLGDHDGAEKAFLAALDMADDADDFEARSQAVERLSTLDRGRAKAASTAELAAPTRLPRLAPGAPCPCGSGRKYKHCHGRRRHR